MLHSHAFKLYDCRKSSLKLWQSSWSVTAAVSSPPWALLSRDTSRCSNSSQNHFGNSKVGLQMCYLHSSSSYSACRLLVILYISSVKKVSDYVVHKNLYTHLQVWNSKLLQSTLPGTPHTSPSVSSIVGSITGGPHYVTLVIVSVHSLLSRRLPAVSDTHVYIQHSRKLSWNVWLNVLSAILYIM